MSFHRDAAHRVHPLAGMGLNLGFGDAKALTETLAGAAYNGSHLGDLQALSEYETKQLRHNVPIMLSIHGLKLMFNTQISPFVLMRSFGLQMTQAAIPLKVSRTFPGTRNHIRLIREMNSNEIQQFQKFFMNRAMGC